MKLGLGLGLGLGVLSGKQSAAQITSKIESTPNSLEQRKKKFMKNAYMTFDMSKAQV